MTSANIQLILAISGALFFQRSYIFPIFKSFYSTWHLILAFLWCFCHVELFAFIHSYVLCIHSYSPLSCLKYLI